MKMKGTEDKNWQDVGSVKKIASFAGSGGAILYTSKKLEVFLSESDLEALASRIPPNPEGN